MGERGQVLPLLAVVVMVAGLACVAIGRLGSAAVSRAQAATAADAAALAGASDGPAAARAAADANGGRMVRFERLGADARVEVQLDRARATARARRSGGAQDGEPAPGLRAALARAEQLLGTRVPTMAVPERGRGEPQSHVHTAGLAVDVADSFVSRLLTVASRAGLCQPYPRSVPGHFELCPQRLP